MKPGRRIRLSDLATETEFQTSVIELAQKCGWLVAHVRPAQTTSGRWITPTTAGLPDLIMVRPPQLVFLEIKKQRGGTRSEAQIEWIWKLQHVDDIEAYFARPSDWDDIEDILRRRPARYAASPG